MTLTGLDPQTAADRIKSGELKLVDIREADEYGREHIGGAISLPLSGVDTAGLMLDADQHAVFHCKSGMRTEANCDRLAAHVKGDAYILEGGLDAWKKAGLPTVQDASAPLPMNRQVQITAGLLVLTGVVLGFVVHPGFFALSGFVGAGLTFAGISGWCGTAHVLAVMPWNRKAGSVS